MTSKSSHNPKCIDLFCGAGGLSKGFEDAGYDILLGVDHDEASIKTFNKNHLSQSGTVTDLKSDSPSEILKNIDTNNIDIVCGGPPCQGLSLSGPRISSDPRNNLYKPFVQIVAVKTTNDK